MTAPVLQRGDLVHIAYSVGLHATPDQAVQQGQQIRADLERAYRPLGVEIALLTITSAPCPPTVVAVFRPAAGSGVTA